MTGSASAKGPFNPFKIGNWEGGAFTNAQTGEFSGCGASVPYLSGTSMHVSAPQSGGWVLAFSNETWQLTPDKPSRLTSHSMATGLFAFTRSQ